MSTVPPRLTAVGKHRSLVCPTMNLLRRCIIPSILAALGLLAVLATALGQVKSSRIDAASLQKKATEAQARIHANKDDRDQLMSAVKTNEIPLAKEVLLRNGFTAEDLENAKITVRTGGGKGGEDEIEISATCCDPKEITIRRSLEYFTK
jgi:type II secretory pathway pseudopilin PulG